MAKIIMALLENGEYAEAVVEELLNGGFAHPEIALMSGEYWLNDLQTTKPGGLKGSEVMLQLRASGEMEKLARELVCNSGALDVLEREPAPQENWLSLVQTGTVRISGD